MRTPIKGMVAPVGTPTRDNRDTPDGDGIESYSASKLPIPIHLDLSNGGEGHNADHPVGFITALTTEDDGVNAVGYLLDPDKYPRFAEAIMDAKNMVEDGNAWPSIGANVDVDSNGNLTADVFEVSLVTMPANAQTWMALDDIEEEKEETGELEEIEELAEDDEKERALVAASTVVEPVPFELFEQPHDMPYTPGFRVDGKRVYGHLTHREACHTAWANTCMKPPTSMSGYALFHRFSQVTDAGTIRVGRLTAGTGNAQMCSCCVHLDIDDHACLNASMVAAMGHHDTLTTTAQVCVGEDDNGNIWVSGVLTDDHPNLSRQSWSGDWRGVGQSAELIEILALNHALPGFTHRRDQRIAQGGLTSLVAAIGTPTQQVPDYDDEKVTQAVERVLRSREERRELTEAISRMHSSYAGMKLEGVGRRV